MKSFAILLLASACVAVGEKPPGAFTIAGVVMDSTTHKPVGQTRIVLTPAERPATEIDAWVTSENGRFQFAVPKGEYDLRAERNGKAAQKFGEDELYPGLGIAVVTGPDQNTGNLVFVLHPPVAISGKVVDEAKEPVENARVQLLRSSVVSGRRKVATFGWAYTNDLGEFRFGNLPAATYFLAVTAEPWYEIGHSPLMQKHGPVSQAAFAPVYYPNTGDARAAAPIRLKAGQESVANFSLYPSFGSSVTVNCAGECGSGLRLDVALEGIEGVDSFQSVIDFNTTTVLPGIPPGHYVVILRSLDTGKPVAGTANLDVTSSDAEVTVVVKEQPKVTGTVVITDGDPKILSRLFVTLRNETQNLSFSRNVAANGTFQVPVYLPGRYRVWLTGVPEVFAKQITSEDHALQDGVIQIGPDTSISLNVAASSGVGRVKGFVHRNGEPAPGVLVIVALATLSANPGDYRSFLTDSDGSFDFVNLRPGDWRLFAVADHRFEYANPVAVRPYLAKAKSVQVTAKGLIEENLDVP